MQINEINNEIERLLQYNSYESCQKLASLFIVREHITKDTPQRTESTQKQLFDILPTYSTFAELKRKYKLGNAGEKAVEISLKNLCQEIYEFLIALHSSTDTKEEKACIYALLERLEKFFKKI